MLLLLISYVYFFNSDNLFNLGYEKDSMKNVTRISPSEY